MVRCLALLLTLGSSVAHAGDPCPIDFNFYDVGAPEWLDRNALLDGLESKDSWVGISFEDSKGAVKVTAVSRNSPAANAGLQVGDLITAAAGKAMATHKALGDLLRATAPGAAVQLAVTRGDKKMDVELTLGRQDPVIGALIDYASKQDCAKVRRGDTSPDMVEATRKLLFEKNKRFRCKDAHQALTKADFGAAGKYEPGDIVVVRGSKRMLFAHPGWGTHCVYARELDGAKLNDANLKRLFEKLTAGYVKDRHDNP